MKLTLCLMGRERSYFIKRYPEPVGVEAPKMGDPTELAEAPETVMLKSEDIENGALDNLGGRLGPEDI
ncbi:MAG: hypothetical protein PHQ43_08735 [Dehalococcoidales bacterium]|nr:hypothetical protein [Dehalococcoidales bacterium]